MIIDLNPWYYIYDFTGAEILFELIFNFRLGFLLLDDF